MSNITNTITEITKSQSDKSNYKHITWSNGLKCLLISDADTDKSAAALCVKIGSFADPKEYPGLAHFIEHMVFMGTEKYPNESEYFDYLSENNGSSNAYTAGDKTVFYFSVTNPAFNEAWDRFAQFFISPLFKKDSIDREVQAVNAENQKNLQSDYWRIDQIKSNEANINSFYNHFGTGNNKTWNKPEIREKMLELYNKFYSSQNMFWSVISNTPMEEWETLVSEWYSKVPTKPGFQYKVYNCQTNPPYDDSNLSFFYKIIPIKDLNKISFNWYFEHDETKNYKSGPMQFWSHWLGHEGPNTLTSTLTRNNYITSLSSGSYAIADCFSMFSINIVLTNFGLEHYQDAIIIVLNYIKTIQAMPLNERFFKEVIEIKQLNFNNKSKSDPEDYVEEWSGFMPNYPPQDILTRENIVTEYKPELIKEILDKFTWRNLNIYFTSQILTQEECSSTCKWYGTSFTKVKINTIVNESEINSYKPLNIFDYPPVNNFIPKCLDVLPKGESDSWYPIRIVDNAKVSIWYKKDNTFLLPKAECSCTIILQNDIWNNSRVVNAILSHVWDSVLTNELMEIKYMAEEANCNFRIETAPSSLRINVAGYNDSIYRTLKEIIKVFNDIDYNSQEQKEKIKLYIHKSIQDYSNYYMTKPYDIVYNDAKNILTTPMELKLDALRAIKMPGMEDKIIGQWGAFVKEVFSKVKYEWLIMGNWTKDEAINISNLLLSDIKYEQNEFDVTQATTFRAVDIIPSTQNILAIDNVLHPKESNSAMTSFYQCGDLDDKQYTLLLILENLLSDKFFDEWRTKQCIGYVTQLMKVNVKGNCGIFCLVQSCDYCPEYVSKRITEFFNVFAKTNVIAGLTDEIFDKHKLSVWDELKKKFIKLNEEFRYYYIEMNKHTFVYNRKQIWCDIWEGKTATIRKEDWIAFFKEHFIDKVKRFDFEWVATGHKEENEKWMEENDKESKEVKRIRVKSYEEFRRINYLFPDFYSCV